MYFYLCTWIKILLGILHWCSQVYIPHRAASPGGSRGNCEKDVSSKSMVANVQTQEKEETHRHLGRISSLSRLQGRNCRAHAHHRIKITQNAGSLLAPFSSYVSQKGYGFRVKHSLCLILPWSVFQSLLSNWGGLGPSLWAQASVSASDGFNLHLAPLLGWL